jgi:hypothetical protein
MPNRSQLHPFSGETRFWLGTTERHPRAIKKSVVQQGCDTATNSLHPPWLLLDKDASGCQLARLGSGCRRAARDPAPRSSNRGTGEQPAARAGPETGRHVILPTGFHSARSIAASVDRQRSPVVSPGDGGRTSGQSPTGSTRGYDCPVTNHPLSQGH